MVSMVACLAAPASLLAQAVNIAPFGTPAQSSEWNNGQFPATLAIDGNFGNFTHTAAEVGPAIWEIDLGAEVDVKRIVLYNRTSCCGSRLRDIVVSIHGFSFLDDDPIDEIDVADPVDPADILPLWDSALWESELLNPENELGGGGLEGPPDLTVDLVALEGAAVTGRFVRVTRIPDLDFSGTGGEGNNGEPRVLSLGEVEVFAEADALPPRITAQPSGGEAAIGESFTFTVEAIGSAPLAYQWSVDDVEIDGATESSLIIDPVTIDDAGVYTVVVSNELGEATSDGATLVVREFPNLARFGIASQSTTGFGGVASRGNDGNTDGVYNNGSVTHTDTGDPSPWWEVVLAGDSAVHEITIWNRTDCCQQRLTNFRVLILDAARDEVWSEEFFTDGFSFPDTAASGFEIDVGEPVEGRIVRVEFIEDPLRAEVWLSLAEVQVFAEGPTEPGADNPNLARLKPAAQSSDLGDNTADRGVDGDTGTFTHTLAGLGPSIWEVDLEEATEIELVVLVNRADCCRSRLRDIVVSIHDISFLDDVSIVDIIDVPLDELGAIWDSAIFESEILNPENELGGGGLGGPVTLRVRLETPVTGRYVRVTRIPDLDLSGTGGQGNADEADVLSLGEVQVYGPLTCPEQGDTTCDGITIEGPDDNNFGDYTVTASASDESGDLILFTFTADDGAGTVIERGPQVANSTTFPLGIGTWTITVATDDDPICEDEAAGSTCTETIEVIDVRCETLGECNIALRGVATQSTTGFGGDASRAIDGNTDGNYGGGSVTHTNFEDPAPWWEVDLGQTAAIDKLLLWNRTDCCANRLHNFRVLVLDDAREVVYSQDFFTDGFDFPDTSFEGFEVEIDGEDGRIVRIELLGDLLGAGLFLSLAEVEVFSSELAECPRDGDADFGDTHCTGLTVTGPEPAGPGTHTVTATATDDTGDAIRYTFTADNGAGVVQTAGPQAASSAQFELDAGTWAITVTVDDSSRCTDAAEDSSCSETVVVGTGAPLFLRGDSTQDGDLNITDAVKIFGVLFLGDPAPTCQEAMDVNDDGEVNITDGIRVLGFLFLGQAPPASPGHETCGPDHPDSPADLGCESHPPCDA